MTDKIRVVIAEDERPARSFLVALLRSFDDVQIVGEAETGTQAVELIEREKPDLAFLDLQMPELDGLGVVRLLSKKATPLIVFVTAYDEYAVNAFDLNAVDYLLKPVEKSRLREAINRAQDRLDRTGARTIELERVHGALADYDRAMGQGYLARIPVRRGSEIRILPVSQIASIVADGELLHIWTLKNEQHTITHRLKDLEARLDPSRFARLGRGTLVSIEAVNKIVPLPGGTYIVHLSNDQQLKVSRMQSRVLRDQLLRL
ncbi:MAG TPA: response regulator transcription factor [Blastocatellia bacterium]|nr:response regulator transcription factor [Blastocatellia bacterium]